MSFIDIILVALIVFGAVRGFTKGLFVEIASLVALVVGVYGAMHFSNFAADFLKEKTDWEENTISIAALAITFGIIVIAVSLAGKALTKLADFAALGIVNRFLGGLFGALKTAVILSVVLIVFDRMNSALPIIDEEKQEQSILYKPVKGLVPLILPSILEAKNNIKDEEESKETATQDV